MLIIRRSCVQWEDWISEEEAGTMRNFFVHSGLVQRDSSQLSNH